MQEFPFAKQWKRPIAEMNILVQQWIFTTDDLQNLNIEDFAKWSFILDLLWRVKERAQCIDNDDQDSDWIKDYVDNCYVTFNPRQTDSDQDKIWDVCDEDIDNDWIKNPVWIVDDAWNIVFDSIQKDSNALSQVLWLAIQQSLLKWDEYWFVAKYVWKLSNFTRDFWDWKTWRWIDVTHLYTKPWVYIVRLSAIDSKGKKIEAVSTLIVWSTQWQSSALSIKQTKKTDTSYDFSPIVIWKLTDYVWDFGDWVTVKWETASHIYTNPWTYTVRVTAKDANWKTITATSVVMVWVSQVSLSIRQTKKADMSYDFSPIVVWKLTDYVWDFGDWVTVKWETVSHTYTNPWTYTVRVTAKDAAWKTVVSTTQIVVSWNPISNVRASLMPAKLTQAIWEKVQYTIVLEGVSIEDIDYVKLTLWDGRTKELRGNEIQKFIDSYSSAGAFLIEWTVYVKNGTKLPLAAFVTVLPSNVISPWSIDNCLYIVNQNQIDDDKNNVWNACDIDERVWISVVPRAITQNHFAFITQSSWSLKNYVRYFGDKNTWSGESVVHTYRNNGLYTVRVEATTPKGKVVSASTSVTVWWPRVALVPWKLVQNVWEKTQYLLQLFNLQVSDIDYVDIQRWDWRTRQIRWSEITKFVDSYNTNWWYGIWWTVYLNNNSTLTIGSYVTVVWPYYCLWASQWSNWWWTCDIDKDTIPDICDTDIDWDWFANPLWLIRFQNVSCTYDGTNVNTNDIKPPLWSDQGDRDNCPFTANPDQTPCTALVKDTDGDGILDIYDVCPAIPEMFNGVEDTDWCPEYNFIVAFPSTKVQPWTCNVCPCQYAQNDSALAAWDRVKAVLYDNISQKPVAESTRYIVP